MSRGERVFLDTAALLASISGVVLLWMKHVLKHADPFSVVNHPWQPQTLEAHVLAAPLLVFALGLIARGHILERFAEGPRNSAGRSGVLAALLAVPMIASGYLLQVATGPLTRRALAATHWVLGGLFVLLYVLHLAVSAPAARAGAERRRGARPRRRGDAGRRLDPFKTPGLQCRNGTAWAGSAARSDGRQR